MNLRNKLIRYMAFLLSLSCLLVFAGCQGRPESAQQNATGEIMAISSNTPTGESTDISFAAASSQPPESEEAPLVEEPPASGNQEARSPSSQAAPTASHPEAPTGKSMDISFAAASSQLPESEATPSMEEPPVSSQEPPSPTSRPASTASQPVASEPPQTETFSISFTIGERVGRWNAHRWEPDKATIVVIRSTAELKALYEQNNEYDAPEHYGKYNDTFFEEHAIVFVGQQFPSGSYQTRVNGLTRSGNQLIVDYSTLILFCGTCDIKISQKLLEVSRADLEGVAEIVPQYHEIHLAAMEDYDESEWRQ